MSQSPNKSCPQCGIDISTSHKNKKFCSAQCVNKDRYIKHGQRVSPEKRQQYYRDRTTRDGYMDKLRAQGRERSGVVREFLQTYKLERGCADCGYKAHHVALDFDHITPDKKLNVCNAKSIEQAKSEIQKCEVVCSNCHRIRTYNRLYPCKPDIFEKTYEPVL